jgi:hypothetical protein
MGAYTPGDRVRVSDIVRDHRACPHPTRTRAQQPEGSGLLPCRQRRSSPVAVIGDLNFVSMLPKTRSGKIMRRVLKAVTLDKDPGDISTIEDAGSVQDAREAWEAMRRQIKTR